MNRYIIIAGETSGDQYGSKLMSEINKISGINKKVFIGNTHGHGRSD